MNRTSRSARERSALQEMTEGHHRGLRNLLQCLHEAIAVLVEHPSSEARVKATEAVAQLRSWAEVHFAEEEKLMEDVEFPETAQHAEHHRHYLEWLKLLDSPTAEHPFEAVAPDIAEQMAAWWDDHAINQDRKLIEFLCLDPTVRPEIDS